VNPTETLYRALKAFLDEKSEEAFEALLDLIDWLVKGGFNPDVKKVIERLQESEAYDQSLLIEEIRHGILPDDSEAW
jgi:hypothetical protein